MLMSVVFVVFVKLPALIIIVFQGEWRGRQRGKGERWGQPRPLLAEGRLLLAFRRSWVVSSKPA